MLQARSCRAVLCHQQLIRGLFFLLQEDNKNFITLVAKHGDGMLVCGTGACAPTCWNLVRWSSLSTGLTDGGTGAELPRSSCCLFHRTAAALGDAAQFGSGPKGKTRAQESLMPM